jgi:hypothetical protein
MTVYEKEGLIPFHLVAAHLGGERDRMRETLIQIECLVTQAGALDARARDRLRELVREGLGIPVHTS